MVEDDLEVEYTFTGGKGNTVIDYRWEGVKKG